MFGPSGILNSSKCLLDAPVFLSKPHFLDVDGSFNGTMALDPGTDVKTRVIGLDPNEEGIYLINASTGLDVFSS